MKTLYLAVLAILAMSGFANAQNDIVTVDENGTIITRNSEHQLSDLHHAKGTVEANRAKLGEVTAIRTDAVTVQGSGPLLNLTNLRAESEHTDFEDLLVAGYEFDLSTSSTLGFDFSDVTIFQDVGIFADGIFIRDSTESLVLTNNTLGTTFTEGTTHSVPFDINTTYSLTMETGQVASFNFRNSGGDVRLIADDPKDNRFHDVVLGRTGGITQFTFIRAFESGDYTLRFYPEGTETGFNVTTSFINANDSETQQVDDDNLSFTGTLTSLHYDYDKYKVTLSAADTLKTSFTGTDTRVNVINSRSVVVSDSNKIGASPLPATNIFESKEAGDYYVVIENRPLTGTSYSITFEITDRTPATTSKFQIY